MEYQTQRGGKRGGNSNPSPSHPSPLVVISGSERREGRGTPSFPVMIIPQ
jgi:hypothetical protein